MTAGTRGSRARRCLGDVPTGVLGPGRGAFRRRSPRRRFSPHREGPGGACSGSCPFSGPGRPPFNPGEGGCPPAGLMCETTEEKDGLPGHTLVLVPMDLELETDRCSSVFTSDITHALDLPGWRVTVHRVADGSPRGLPSLTQKQSLRVFYVAAPGRCRWEAGRVVLLCISGPGF